MGCCKPRVELQTTDPILRAAVVQILHAVVRQKNGAVSDAMADRGVDYSLNYGVSAITVRDICEPYATRADRQPLAEALWREQVRELRLAAIFIADPAAVTLTQAVEWSRALATREMAEHCAMRLWALSPQALTIARSLLESPSCDELQAVAAHHTIARACRRYETAELAPLVRLYGPQTHDQAAVVALREVWTHHPDLRHTVEQVELPAALESELRWQIEF